MNFKIKPAVLATDPANPRAIEGIVFIQFDGGNPKPYYLIYGEAGAEEYVACEGQKVGFLDGSGPDVVETVGGLVIDGNAAEWAGVAQ